MTDADDGPPRAGSRPGPQRATNQADAASTWSGALSRKPAPPPARRARDAGRGRATPLSGAPRRGAAAQLVGSGSRRSRSATLGQGGARPGEKTRLVRRTSPRARCSVTGPSVVGQEIADHATPTALNDGVLSVTAESTAWATQLRMIQAQLLAKIAAAVGNGVVTSLKITGPAAPSWRKGPRHIAGRGPRDTYG